MFKKNFKFALLIALALALTLSTAALGQYSEISWTGHGSNSMDCTKYDPEGGMHWIFTEASKVKTAMVVLNGDEYPISKRSGPTIHFDTPYYPLEGLVAKVVYTGTLGRHSKLVLSDYCPGYKPLEAEKTAAGSYDRTIEWKLDKWVEPASHNALAGQLAGESIWTVKATKTETLDNYKVVGEITIINPNVFAVPFTVDDVLNDGTVADVTCPAYTIPAESTLTCSYVAYPPDGYAGLNTATVKSYVGGAVAEAVVEFKENLIGYEEGTLKDPRFGYEKLIGSSITEQFPEAFYCSKDTSMYSGGTYQYTEVNWAYLNGNLNLEDSAEVTVTCTLPPLEVEKTAAGTWDRDVSWELKKSVAPDSFSGFPGDAFNAVWEVVATKHDTGPVNYRVTGKVTIYNPAPIPQTFSIEDVLTGAREDLVPVQCPTDTVEPLGTVECTYNAKQPDATATLNTVTVYAKGNAPQVATAKVSWEENLYGQDSGTLKDSRFAFEEVISTSATRTFPETFYCPPSESGLYVNGHYNFEQINSADLNVNLNLSASAKVLIECRQPEFHGETAWAGDTGFNIMNPGQWWYVFDTSGPVTQAIWAGQTMNAGSVTISEAVDGYRTITINLAGAWVLKDDSEPVKIQGYSEIPGSAPSPGLFTTYKGNMLEIVVPDFAIYAIHLDVGYWK